MTKKRYESAVPEVKQISGRRDQCAYELDGQRCQYTGTLATTTLGDGPFFCRWHFECASPAVGEEIIRQSRDYKSSTSAVDQARARYLAGDPPPARIRKMSVAECRAEIKRLLPGIGGRPPGTDWAVRIMDRIAAGEKLSMISEQRRGKRCNCRRTASQARAAKPLTRQPQQAPNARRRDR